MPRKGLPKVVEAERPEALVKSEPAISLGQRARLDAAAVRAAFDGAAEQARFLEDLHVFRGGSEGHVERLGQLADRPHPACQPLQHRPPGGIAQCAEHAIEGSASMLNHTVEHMARPKNVQPSS